MVFVLIALLITVEVTETTFHKLSQGFNHWVRHFWCAEATCSKTTLSIWGILSLH